MRVTGSVWWRAHRCHTDSRRCPQEIHRNSQPIGTDAPQATSFMMAPWSHEPFRHLANVWRENAVTVRFCSRPIGASSNVAAGARRSNSARTTCADETDDCCRSRRSGTPKPSGTLANGRVGAPIVTIVASISSTRPRKRSTRCGRNCAVRPRSPRSCAAGNPDIRSLCRHLDDFSTRRLTQP